MNSDFIFHYLRTFVNNTVSIQMNDIRQIPFVIPTKEEISKIEKIFDSAYDIKQQYFMGQMDELDQETNLVKIANILENAVKDLYKFKM